MSKLRCDTSWTKVTASEAHSAKGCPLFKSGRMTGSAKYAILLVLVICVPFQSNRASLLLKNLSATADFSGMQLASEGSTKNRLRQELSANWFQNLTPYLSVYASTTYYKTDLENVLELDTDNVTGDTIQNQSFEISMFKEEFSPSAKVTLNHPLVRLNTNLSRTESVGTLLSEELVRTSFSSDLQSKMIHLPVFSAQYARGTSRDNQNLNGRNTKDNSFGISVNDEFGDWSGRYRMSRLSSQNLVTQYETVAYRHTGQLLWASEVVYKKPIKLYGDYLLVYSSQTDRIPGDSTVLHEISPATGLYGQHQDATYGWLDPQNDLTDNDRNSPTSPLINIGTGSTNQHLGVDLSIPRLVSGLYIYTDRLSDESVIWEIYVSDDGLEWRLYDVSPDLYFDVNVNRYELVFDELQTRYVKAVNTGLNRIETVLVTELVPLAAVANTGELTQSNQSHRINVGGSVQLNEKWKANSDISFQSVPLVGLSGSRNNFSQTILASYRATEALQHSLSFQFDLNNSSGAQQDFSSYFLSYNAKYDPLPTIGLTGSVRGRITRIGGNRETESINLTSQLTADPLEDITFEMVVSYGWDNLQSVARESHSLNTKFSLNARPSRSFSFRLAYRYLGIDVINAPEINPQHEYLAKVTVRPFQKLQLNGQVTRTTGRHKYLRRLLTASYKLTKTLSISGQYQFSTDSEENRAERQIVNLSWRLGGLADIYMGYNKNDLSGTRASTEAVNAGVRLRI